jgi:hypothetical protein
MTTHYFDMQARSLLSAAAITLRGAAEGFQTLAQAGTREEAISAAETVCQAVNAAECCFNEAMEQTDDFPPVSEPMTEWQAEALDPTHYPYLSGYGIEVP